MNLAIVSADWNEYFYENDTMTDTYPLDTNPEQNISTLVNFAAKWKDMLLKNTPIPTPVKQHSFYKVGVYEGGATRQKDIYRPAYDCRMKKQTNIRLSVVCQRALKRIIEFYVP